MSGVHLDRLCAVPGCGVERPRVGVAGGGGVGPVSRVKVEAEICCCLPLPHLPQTLQKPSPELKQQLTGHSKRVAGSVTELIQAAEAMKGEG